MTIKISQKAYLYHPHQVVILIGCGSVEREKSNRRLWIPGSNTFLYQCPINNERNLFTLFSRTHYRVPHWQQS